MSLHGHVAGLLPVLDPAWRQKIFRGGLLLCIPMVGWPAALGYRARFVRHMFGATEAPLPDWDEGFFGFVYQGLLAMAVIFGYLLPLYVALALTVTARGFAPDATWAWLAAGFVVFPIFSPLAFPVACALLTAGDAPWLSRGESAAFTAAYAFVVFLIPAGFLEVSRTGRHVSAFALWRTLPFVVRNLGTYLEAWLRSGLMSLAGHFALPIAPWGVIWSYLGILAAFNELLLREGLAPGEGWLQRGLADPRLQRRGGLGRFALVDGGGEAVTAVDLGLFAAPLPRG